MKPHEQVDHLKHSIQYFLDEVRGKNGGFSLEGVFFALNDLEQSLNIHDCQDPTVGCSCSGSVRFPWIGPAPDPETVTASFYDVSQVAQYAKTYADGGVQTSARRLLSALSLASESARQPEGKTP